MGATSRPDMIDPALLRPGRLDRQLYCGFPNNEEKLEILRALSQRMALEDGADQCLCDVAVAPAVEHFTGGVVRRCREGTMYLCLSSSSNTPCCQVPTSRRCLARRSLSLCRRVYGSWETCQQTLQSLRRREDRTPRR
jgi:hypothetical protein